MNKINKQEYMFLEMLHFYGIESFVIFINNATMGWTGFFFLL